MNFKQLHQQVTPLIIGNVWDVSSTRAAENANFQALGTSSAAIAAMLGYPDGEHIPVYSLPLSPVTTSTSIRLSRLANSQAVWKINRPIFSILSKLILSTVSEIMW